MELIFSILFTISFLCLFFGIYFFKKNAEKLNAVLWIIPSFFISLFYLAASFGIINLFKIPVNILSGSIICLLLAAVLWYFIIRKKLLQTFFFSLTDMICAAVIALTAAFYAVSQFGLALYPIYATSDPSVHLQMAMDIVNNGMLEKMFFAPMVNSLMIELLSFAVSATRFYKIFILSDILFFMISGLAFYSLAAERTSSVTKKIIALVLTFFYMICYPLNNMVFGFCYLGISVSIIAVIIMLIGNYGCDSYNQPFLIITLMTAMFSLAICYILFAPVCFIAGFIIIALHFLKRKKLFSLQHIIHQLAVFLLPLILSIYYFVFRSSDFSMMNLTNEGYIYRDIALNFLFLIIPLVIALTNAVKSKKISPSVIFFIILIIYMLATFLLMYKSAISSYYFYKAYYPLSLLCFSIIFEYIADLKKAEIHRPVCYILSVALLFGISELKIEERIKNKSPYFCDKTAIYNLFDIYHFNTDKIFSDSNDERSYEWDKRLELYDYTVDNCSPDNNVYLADTWLNIYWYEAVTNQRFTGLYHWVNKDRFKEFIESCEYVVIIPESEDYKENTDIFEADYEKLFENEIGFVAKFNWE